MIEEISGTLLLDSNVIDDPYPLYRQLHAQAPVWKISDTGLFAVSTFDLVAEVAARVEDFSSNISFLLYRDETGPPIRPCTVCTEIPFFPSWWQNVWPSSSPTS